MVSNEELLLAVVLTIFALIVCIWAMGGKR
jgi:hypothetical protein